MSPTICTAWKYRQAYPFFFVIFIVQSNTTSLKRTINNSKTNVEVFTKYVKTKSGSDQMQPFLLLQTEQIRVQKEVKPQFDIRDIAIGSTQHLNSLCKKRFRQKCFHSLIRNFFIVVTLEMQNSTTFGEDSLEIVG